MHSISPNTNPMHKFTDEYAGFHKLECKAPLAVPIPTSNKSSRGGAQPPNPNANRIYEVPTKLVLLQPCQINDAAFGYRYQCKMAVRDSLTAGVKGNPLCPHHQMQYSAEVRHTGHTAQLRGYLGGACCCDAIKFDGNAPPEQKKTRPHCSLSRPQLTLQSPEKVHMVHCHCSLALLARLAS